MHDKHENSSGWCGVLMQLLAYYIWHLSLQKLLSEFFIQQAFLKGPGEQLDRGAVAMSLFDQPYYAITKAHMSRVGIWPEQSKYVRIIWPLTMFTLAMSLIVPGLIRLHDAWRDINVLARSSTALLIAIGVFCILLSFILQIDIMQLFLKSIEEFWQKCENTPLVSVLDKYAEQGRYITLVYSTCVYTALTILYVSCLSPVIFDYIDPVNKSRSKIYFLEAEYGVDADKYYWLIIGHTFVTTTTVVVIMLGILSMYILLVVHACTLFEVVRSMGVAMGIIAIMIIISTVQALKNWNHPEVLIQQLTLIIVQVLNLYVISIPGQELINRSENIHTIAYNLDWFDMSVNVRKLLLPILIRSSKPCYFTAGSVYILSTETFGSAIRTVVSYIAIFARMV